jgi:hypothetical protein
MKTSSTASSASAALVVNVLAMDHTNPPYSDKHSRIAARSPEAIRPSTEFAPMPLDAPVEEPAELLIAVSSKTCHPLRQSRSHEARSLKASTLWAL